MLPFQRGFHLTCFYMLIGDDNALCHWYIGLHSGILRLVFATWRYVSILAYQELIQTYRCGLHSSFCVGDAKFGVWTYCEDILKMGFRCSFAILGLHWCSFIIAMTGVSATIIRLKNVECHLICFQRESGVHILLFCNANTLCNRYIG